MHEYTPSMFITCEDTFSTGRIEMGAAQKQIVVYMVFVEHSDEDISWNQQMNGQENEHKMHPHTVFVHPTHNANNNDKNNNNMELREEKV